jgi:hypothetical protein
MISPDAHSTQADRLSSRPRPPAAQNFDAHPRWATGTPEMDASEHDMPSVYRDEMGSFIGRGRHTCLGRPSGDETDREEIGDHDLQTREPDREVTSRCSAVGVPDVILATAGLKSLDARPALTQTLEGCYPLCVPSSSIVH